MKGKSKATDDEQGVRVDKWLWAARFFKTRRLATEAIQGGKVLLNGSRAKPSKIIKEGAEVRITQNGFERVFIVKAVSDKRGPAPVAQQLYEETEESIKGREAHLEMIKNTPGFIRTEGRPNKKDRRLIHRFKQKNQG